MSIEHQSDTGAHRVVFDATEVKPSTAVVKMIGEIRGADTTELEPLYSVIDTEALNRICMKQNREGDRIVEFSYLDHRVMVKSYGVITAQPLSENTGKRDGKQ